jgi:hypothetical protein
MTHKTINILLLIITIIIIIATLIINLSLYLDNSPVKFTELNYARVIGSDALLFHIEMNCFVDSKIKLPYEISFEDANLYDDNALVNRVIIKKSIMKFLKRPNVTMLVSIPRDKFIKITSNKIDDYAMQLKATAIKKTFFFSKKIEINETIPINFLQLMQGYLTDLFNLKHTIRLESINHIPEGNEHYFYCRFSIQNQSRINIAITGFDAKINMSSGVSGTSVVFEPLNFTEKDEFKPAYIRFKLSEQPKSYLTSDIQISGTLKVRVWNRNYNIPIEIFNS